MLDNDVRLGDGRSEASYVDEQGLLELSARLPPGLIDPDASSASSSYSSQTGFTRRWSQASATSPSDGDEAQGLPSPSRKASRRPGRRVQQDGGESRQRPRLAKPQTAQQGLETSQLAFPIASPKVVRSAPLEPSESRFTSIAAVGMHTFLRDLRSALILMITEVFFPLVLTLSSSLLALAGKKHSPEENSRGHLSRSKERHTLSKANTRPPGTGRSFAEKFKFVICTSFLLTSSLSISFYGSEPETQQPSPVDPPIDPDSERTIVLTQRAPRPVRASNPVTRPDAVSGSSTGTSTSLLPRLTRTGRSIRDATLLATGVLAVLSSSWDSWFRSCLGIVCLTWASILAMSLAELDDSLLFDLSHMPSPSASRYLLEARSHDGLSPYEQKLYQQDVLRKVKKLVKSAQAYDVVINKCIGAVQEVELVSRGYKLTHPLPPISRIEAASAATGGTTWGSLTSPPRNRHSILGLGNTAGARLSRSSSAGASAASNRKHAHRPLSLSLSNGRASPAFSSESHDGGELGRRSGGLGEPTASVYPRRLATLRQTVLTGLDQVMVKCTGLTRELEYLVDQEELMLLHDMYALEGPISGAGSDSDLPEATGLDEKGDRSVWAATTPRNTGRQRQSLEMSSAVGRGEDESWTRSVTSPVGQKRLSLLSDSFSASTTPYDRAAGASSSASKRDNLISDGHTGSYRSPRLTYVTDKSGNPGPNDSAANKRLSYISASSAAGSIGSRSPLPPTFVGASPPYRAGSPFGTYISPSSRNGESRMNRMSVIGPNSIFNVGQHKEVVDPQTLLGLKNRFERTHLARRRFLCHLLALDFSMDQAKSKLDAPTLSVDDYWERSCLLMTEFTELLDSETKAASIALREEMGVDLGTALQGRSGRRRSETEATMQGQLASPLLGDQRGPQKASSGITGHLGLEDRFAAMAVTLRSIQAKLRVCAEDVGVRSPAELHGLEPNSAVDLPTASGANEVESMQAYTDRVQQMFEGIKDDLLALSSEWEAGVKIFKKEKRSTASPAAFDTDAEVTRLNAARDLESPMEADEDVAKVSDDDLPGRDDAALCGSHKALATANENDEDDDDDIAALLLRSTSPQHLPPPGLEQVFESIAGIASIAGIGGSKLSREERIRQAEQRREEELEEKAKKASHRHTIDPAGIVSELNDVIRTRKANREQTAAGGDLLGRQSLDANRHRHSPMMRQNLTDEEAVSLGSPLELGGMASIAGVFESAATHDGDAWMPAVQLSPQSASKASRRASRYNVANERRSPALYRHTPKHSDETTYSFPSHITHHVSDQADSSFLSASTSDSRLNLEASSTPRTLNEMDSPAAQAATRNALTQEMRSPSWASISGSSSASPSQSKEASFGGAEPNGGSSGVRPASTTAAFALDLDLEKHVAEFAARKRREATAINEDMVLEAE